VISSNNLFEIAPEPRKLHEETWVGSRTRKQSRARELARMLVVPAIVAASIGTAVGVYISYRGHKSPPKASASATVPSITTPAPAPSREIQMPVTSTAPDPNSESPNAATASAGGGEAQPPTKAEDAALQQEAAALAASNAGDPAGEPTLTRDAPVTATRSTQPAVAAVAAVATNAPVIQEVKTSKGVVKLVDVRIDSKPSGATVMLVDNGKTSFLGTTPLATTVDASQQYDVVFTLQGRPTQMAHLDPTTSARLDVKLPRAASKAAPVDKLADFVEKPAVVEKKSEAKIEAKTDAKVATKTDAKVATKTDARAETKTDVKAETKKGDAKTDKKAAKLAEPTFDEAAELASIGEAPAKKPEKAAKADAAGEGTLMISSKPPCDIFIDGKATGLTTPQRSISLPVGTHKITLVNTAEGIKKTLPVQITADKPTKLIQDLMAK
jgi:hypothetical protein